MSFTEVMEGVTRAFEAVAVVVLVAGFVWGAITALRVRFTGHKKDSYRTLRRSFGRTILLGLEILVAADLIRTVAVDQTWENVLGLGLIVVIRTFLSFSLEVEMDGVWPWRRRAAGVAGPDSPAGTSRRSESATPPRPLAEDGVTHRDASSCILCR